MKTESKKARSQLDEKYQQWRGFFLTTLSPDFYQQASPLLNDVHDLVDYVTMLKSLLFDFEQRRVWNWNSFFIGLIPFVGLLIYLLVNH